MYCSNTSKIIQIYRVLCNKVVINKQMICSIHTFFSVISSWLLISTYHKDIDPVLSLDQPLCEEQKMRGQHLYMDVTLRSSKSIICVPYISSLCPPPSQITTKQIFKKCKILKQTTAPLIIILIQNYVQTSSHAPSYARRLQSETMNY